MLNPYQIRNGIRDGRHFFGRRRELDELLALINGAQPQCVAVIGDRRIGKSSLLQALYRRSRGNDETVVTYQDVNGLNSSEEVLTALVDNLALAAHTSDAPGASVHNSLRRLVSQLSKRSRIVLMLDEFDALTRRDAFAVTFFNFLRGLANEFPVAFVLTARRKLKDICHSEEVAGSPFFNILHERRLGCFRRDEALQLIEEPSAEAGYSLKSDASEVIEFAGCWPLFVQIMCYWLIEFRTQGLAPAQAMTSAQTRASEEISTHLAYLWRQLSMTERLILSSKTCDTASTGASPATVEALIDRGLLRRGPDSRYELGFEVLRRFVANADASPCDVHPASPVRVFVSYCHRDARLIERFGIIDSLRDLETDGFEIFSDHQLRTGDSWNDLLQHQLRQSKILVALVTPDYLRSRYCQAVEIRTVWERRLKEGLVIFPIIVGPCEWDRHEWLRTTQFLPRKGTVITDFKGPAKRQLLLVDVVRELRSVGQRIRGVLPVAGPS